MKRVWQDLLKWSYKIKFDSLIWDLHNSRKVIYSSTKQSYKIVEVHIFYFNKFNNKQHKQIQSQSDHFFVNMTSWISNCYSSKESPECEKLPEFG